MFKINELIILNGNIEEIPVGHFTIEQERDAALKKHFFFIEGQPDHISETGRWGKKG